MTTKLKIILGFTVMVFLLGGISFLGFQSNRQSTENFDEYERLAVFNTSSSDLVAAMYKASSELYTYVRTQKPENINASRAAVDMAVQKVAAAEKVAVQPERIAATATLSKEVQSFKALQDTVQKNIEEAEAIYRKVVQEEARSMMANLKDLTKQAAASQNVTALVSITEVWDDLASARSSISRYAESFMLEDATRTQENFANIAKALEALRPEAVFMGSGTLFAALNKNFSDLTSGFTSMEAKGRIITETLVTLSTAMAKQIAVANSLSEEVAGQMDTYGQGVHQEANRAESLILALSIAGILLAAAIAAFIVLSLIRVLRQMSGFATAVSQGNFDYPVSVREGGEIGDMLKAMREIPAVLRRLIDQANVLSDAILTGKYRERLEKRDFPGAYSDIATSVNTVSDAYTRAIDSIPLPIITCDLDFKMLYLNQATQTVLGGNPIGEQCGGHFKSPICGNDSCAALCAKRNNGPYVTETEVHPNGLDLTIAVTALPLFNAKGEMRGHIEICTDLTEVRAKEKAILTVANQASDIADRVAAASEQIAAQVEQISRGAEVQSDRVSSTASAMTEMNATVLEVARSAGEASEQSNNTKTKASDGAGLVRKVVDSINLVNQTAASLENSMQDLGTQAENIGGVMNVISDVADQTNLLALNAAIEAARAGEAGRGFAVVADEVRKLAERTMAATQEVGSGISAIQQSARNNLTEMSNAVKSVSQATELANSSGTALTEIVELASNTSSVVASIATAAEEQSSTSEEINRSIDEINRIVGETSEGITQSSAAVQELSRMAQELRTVMDGLKKA